MTELFTSKEVENYFSEEVADAGGARAWLRKKKLTAQFAHIDHMSPNGGIWSSYAI